MDTSYSRTPTIESAALDRECILFHPDANRFFVLNGTASFIWARLETSSTVEEIATELRRHFRDVDEERAQEDVRTALEHMLELSVVESSTTPCRELPAST